MVAVVPNVVPVSVVILADVLLRLVTVPEVKDRSVPVRFVTFKEPKVMVVVAGNDTTCEAEMAIAVTPFVWMFNAPELSAENVMPVTFELIPESALMILAIMGVLSLTESG